jgi:hypothetical protein
MGVSGQRHAPAALYPRKLAVKGLVCEFFVIQMNKVNYSMERVWVCRRLHGKLGLFKGTI